MKRVRMAIGLLLIIGSIAGLIYWETDGREAVLMDQVLVAKDTILPGTLVTAQHFTEAGVLGENKIEGALRPDRVSEVIGKRSIQLIVKNGQISEDYFAEDDFYLKEQESLFVVKPEWIAMRSSSLRKGDWVDIYDDRGYSLIGTYRVAFVKDSNEVEVLNSGNSDVRSVLDRTDSTSVVSHVEIISDMTGYKEILKHVQGVTPGGLILVQSEEALS